MFTFLKTVFQPFANRHYTNKKTSFLFYSFSYIPATIICLYAAIFQYAFFWLVLFAMIIYALVDYFLFDALSDKIMWKLLWSRFYEEKHFENSAEHDIIKAYERNPSDTNRAQVEKDVRNRSRPVR
jgi:hypothetical protein